MTRTRFLPDAEATASLASGLAASSPERAVVWLQGDLGAGKSTLARAWLRELGVQGAIRSPTYTLVERYPIPGGEAAHLDLYRLGDASELDFLGLDALVAEATLWLVEWPERVSTGLPVPDLRIGLHMEADGRRATLVPGTEAGQLWLDQTPF